MPLPVAVAVAVACAATVRLVWALCTAAISLPITGTSSGSSTSLVNKPDYIKAESRPVGARQFRRLGAGGNRCGRLGVAGSTARRGR
jgi:hypothetical protein